MWTCLNFSYSIKWRRVNVTKFCRACPSENEKIHKNEKRFRDAIECGIDLKQCMSAADAEHESCTFAGTLKNIWTLILLRLKWNCLKIIFIFVLLIAVNFSGQPNSPGTDAFVSSRSEPISLSTLENDCFIIPIRSLDRFLPAGIPVSVKTVKKSFI